MTDAAFLELIASYEQTLVTLERAVTAIETLIDAHEAGERPSDQTLHDYRGQCVAVERGIVDLRSRLAALKTQVQVH